MAGNHKLFGPVPWKTIQSKNATNAYEVVDGGGQIKATVWGNKPHLAQLLANAPLMVDALKQAQIALSVKDPTEKQKALKWIKLALNNLPV